MQLIDKVFVTHWPPLRERKKYLKKTLRELRIDAEWVTRFDKRKLSPKFIEKYYKFDKDLIQEKLKVWEENFYIAPLSPAEIANGITHIYFFEQIVKNSYDVTLILEDDVVLVPDFAIQLEKYVKQLPDDWDIFYPGSGMDMHVQQTQPTHNVYRPHKPHHRTADCYLVRQKAAARILAAVVPFTWPFDIELEHWQSVFGLNVYWGEPSLSVQGSEAGLYQSTVPGRGY